MNYSGKWALITGASAGIGAAFARSFVKKGANLILVARRLDRLEKLAEDLSARYAVQCIAIAADLSIVDEAAKVVERIYEKGAHVDVLVNNAGYGMPGRFEENNWEETRKALELMVTGYAHFTHLVLPGMQERGWGRIIHVASLAGLVPGSARHTMYGASKGFMVSFAQSLAAENETTGVKVSAICPGFTYSEFHDVNGTRALVSKLPSYVFMEAEPVVEGAIRAVEGNHVVYVPGAWNKFTAWVMKALPRPWAAALVKKQSASFRKANG